MGNINTSRTGVEGNRSPVCHIPQVIVMIEITVIVGRNTIICLVGVDRPITVVPCFEHFKPYDCQLRVK